MLVSINRCLQKRPKAAKIELLLPNISSGIEILGLKGDFHSVLWVFQNRRYKSSLLNQKGTLCACQPLCLPIRFWEMLCFPLWNENVLWWLEKERKKVKKQQQQQKMIKIRIRNCSKMFTSSSPNFQLSYQFCWATAYICLSIQSMFSFYSILHLSQRMLSDSSKANKIKRGQL